MIGEAPQGRTPHGIAAVVSVEGDLLYRVSLYAHDEASCDEAKSGAVHDGANFVSATFSPTRPQLNSVHLGGYRETWPGMEGHRVTGIEGMRMHPASPHLDDQLSICVPHITFTPDHGYYAGKVISVEGQFNGAVCSVAH